MKVPKPDTAPAAAEAPSDSAKGGDVALVHAVGADGSVHVIRRRGDRLEAGALQPLREGAPIVGEVVSLRPRSPSFPALCDVEVLYEPPATQSRKEAEPPPARRKGPAQIATESYRANWDSIWSRKSSDQLN